MNDEDFKKITEGIQQKIGEDNSSKINDDIATMITANTKLNNEIKNKDEEIENLKKEKENLVKVNQNLFLQVTSGKEETKENNQEEEEKHIDFNSCFDEKGNFIK